EAFGKQLGHSVANPGAVGHSGLADAHLGFHLRAGVFAGGVLEVRAAVVILRLGLDAEVEEGDDALFGLLPILGELLPVLAPLLVERLEVGDHQVVLGAEEGVEAGLGNVRVPEDAINADHADTFGGEEVGGAGQQALPRARTVTAPGGCLLGGGLLLRSFLCRGLFGGPHPSVTSSSFRSNKALPWPWVVRPG